MVPEAGPEDEYDEVLTYEEENAVCYVGGYVVHSLKSKEEKELNDILKDLTDNDRDSRAEDPAQEWTSAIGLTHITTDAYQFFYAVETCIRRYLKVSKQPK